MSDVEVWPNDNKALEAVFANAIRLRVAAVKYHLATSIETVHGSGISGRDLQELVECEVLAKLKAEDFAAEASRVLKNRCEVAIEEASWTVAVRVCGATLYGALDAYAKKVVAGMH